MDTVKNITWDLGQGKTLSITIELALETSSGIAVSYNFNGKEGTGYSKFNEPKGKAFSGLGEIIEIHLTKSKTDEIEKLRAELKLHPDWIKKQAKRAKNIAEIKKYEKINAGLCPICGSRCYGDCEAN